MADNKEFQWAVSEKGYDLIPKVFTREPWNQFTELFGGAATSRYLQLVLDDDPNRLLNWFLTDGSSPDRPAKKSKIYHPMSESPGLFREFADLDPSPDGIMRFACKYGVLGDPVQFGLRVTKHLLTGEVDAETWGEPISAWVTEILSLRLMLALWDAATRDEVQTLKKFIIWESPEDLVLDKKPCLGEYATLYPQQEIREVIASRRLDIRSGLLSIFSRGDVKGPALYMVAHIVNRQWPSLVSPFLKASDNDNETPMELAFRPISLLGAIWLQAALAIVQGRRHRRCSECRRWFELSADARGQGRTYCSHACRIRAYRARRAERSQGFYVKEEPI